MGDKDKRRRKSSGLGLAIWILAFLILVIIFLVKADEIKANLERAKVFERLFGKTPSFLKAENSKSDEKKDDSETIVLSNVKKANNSDKKTGSESLKKLENIKNEEKTHANSEEKNLSLKKDEKSDFAKNEGKKENPENSKSSKYSKDDSDLNRQITSVKENKADSDAEKDAQKTSANLSESGKTPAEKEKTEEKSKVPSEKEKTSEKASENAKIAENKPSNTIAAKICFVAIDSDGPVIRKEVGRSVAKDSPLTNCIISLLSGPTASESATGCRTLIPSGTRLYSASVKNGVATLDFSEEFEFNSYGVEGYLGQLMQIVYTATNFSTVDSVQILIEGQKKGYLGSEGVWIGSPLSRSSFR